MRSIASFFYGAACMRYITNVILLSKFVIEIHVASFLDEAAERLVSHEIFGRKFRTLWIESCGKIIIFLLKSATYPQE
jgi:hypothetical protein